MTTENIAYGTFTAMDVTNLSSLVTDSSDAFSFWQSALVDNRTTLAIDYEVFIDLVLTTGTVGGDYLAYVYVVPWVYNGSAWVPGGNLSTTTAPSGTEGYTANGMSDPNSMRGPYPIPAKVPSQHLQGFFTIREMCGGICPDGWSLVIRNNTGINLTSGNAIGYRPITFTAA